MYSVFILLTFTPLLPSALYPTIQLIFHLFLALATDRNVICEHHGPRGLMPDLTRQPITIENKQGLKAGPWCSPTFTSNPSVTPTAHLTGVLSSCILYYVLYISCTILTCFSATPDFLMQYHTSFLGTLS